MRSVADFLDWFAPPAIEATRYRCLECNLKLQATDSVCPECGREVQEVTEPVMAMDWEAYH